MSNKFVLFFPFFFWWHIILHVNIFCVPFLIFSHSTLLRVFMGFSIIRETVNGNLLAGLNDLQIECGRIYKSRWDFNGRDEKAHKLKFPITKWRKIQLYKSPFPTKWNDSRHQNPNRSHIDLKLSSNDPFRFRLINRKNRSMVKLKKNCQKSRKITNYKWFRYIKLVKHEQSGKTIGCQI